MKKCLQCRKEHNRRFFCSHECSDKYRYLHLKDRQRKIVRDRNTEIKRKKGNIGELADVNDVIFYGYKPPFKKLKEGFGYEGVLLYSKKDGKVQCHVCGKLFRSLNSHHLKLHKLSVSSYKEKYKLSQGTALMGEETRKMLIERPRNSASDMAALRKAAVSNNEYAKKGSKHRKRSLEKHNELGTCPDQLLERIQEVEKKLGHTPTMSEFREQTEGKYLGSVLGTYGTWSTAIKKLGMKPNAREYTDRELLQAMRDFVKIQKRSPRWSDMRRGLLPSANIYISRFGNINRARLLSGVPLVIQLTHGYEEWVPSEKEREVMLKNS